MSPIPPIPFNRATLVGDEQRYIAQALCAGRVSGDGPFTQRCHALLERELGVGRALLTTSCTHALEMAALLLDIRPGDEVIVPSFTFVSTANAFALRGARLVFADIRPDTLNLDERLLPGLITPRTRAVAPVHYAGVGCEMDAICALARRHGLAVVEDNAHGLFGRYRGRPLGSFGVFATLSFHETKNFTCGEGGALLINDAALAERAEIVREKGTNRARFFRGQVDKYTWVDLGSSYLPSDVLAAYLLAQLEARERVTAARRRIYERYAAELAPWARAQGVALPAVPEHCDHPYHIFHMLLPAADARQALIGHLREQAIGSAFHYLPLHRSDAGRRYGQPACCPVADDVSERLLRLPFYTGLAPADQSRVIAAVTQFQT